MKRSHIAFALICSAISALCVWGVRSIADIQVTQGTGTSMATFPIAGAGGTVHIPGFTPLTSNGLAYVDGTSSDAVWVSGNGTNNSVLKAIANNTAASLPTGTNTIGNININLNTTSGWSGKLLTNLTSVPQIVKSSAGQLGSIYCANESTTSWAYIQVFDTSPTVTVGSTSPLQSYGIPPSNASGKAMAIIGLQFNNAIQVASTQTQFGSGSITMGCNAEFK